MPYSEDMMKKGSNPLPSKTLHYYELIALYTLYFISENLEGKVLTERQRQEIEKDKEKLMESIDYVVPFSIVLHDRSNIQRVLTRILPADHWLEKKFIFGVYSLYSLARESLLFEWLLRSSQKERKKQTAVLLQKGELLFEGRLYQNEEEIKEASDKIIDDIIKEGGMSDISRTYNTDIWDKIGNFFREIKYPLQSVLFMASDISLVVDLPFQVVSIR